MKIGSVTAAVAAALSMVSATSSAMAACWSPRAVEAAQVRDFETMLMVATLRCQIRGVDLTSDYNRFIREKRAVLTGVNDELRANFTARGLAGKAALDAYDRFVTSLANSYGSGMQGVECSDFQAIMGDAIAAPADRTALLNLAVRIGSNPIRDADRCAARIALAK